MLHRRYERDHVQVLHERNRDRVRIAMVEHARRQAQSTESRRASPSLTPSLAAATGTPDPGVVGPQTGSPPH